MKYYKLEPSYKKSVVELTIFKRPLQELTGDESHAGKDAFVRKELGWRWGDWLIRIPETEEEIAEYLEEKGLESLDEAALYHGYFTFNSETNEEIPDEDFDLRDVLLPKETDDFVDITEDFEDAEMLSTWDGCWEDWSIYCPTVEVFDHDESWIEAIEEAYDEEYEDGVEALGWQYVDTFFEMHCNPVITECDENGENL